MDLPIALASVISLGSSLGRRFPPARDKRDRPVRDAGCELVSAAEFQLGEHAGEVILDRLRAEIQLGSDLPIRQARRHRSCHPELLNGQATEVGVMTVSGPQTQHMQLQSGALRKGVSAESSEDLLRRPERTDRGLAPLQPEKTSAVFKL
jgi:hypothetical protein